MLKQWLYEYYIMFERPWEGLDDDDDVEFSYDFDRYLDLDDAEDEEEDALAHHDLDVDEE